MIKFNIFYLIGPLMRFKIDMYNFFALTIVLIFNFYFKSLFFIQNILKLTINSALIRLFK